MIIHKLILHKFKRLSFSGIDTMTYEPEHIHQIILGTNGSGKSSVLSQLSPLPAQGNDFHKGGFKHIEVEHKQKHYTCINDYSSKSAGHHSFVLQGQELNDGGTLTVQKQLVKEYFGLDQELFDLLIGQSNFREMSPNQRRQWLVRMADDNMEYVIELYNNLKRKLRDADSIVKYHDDRLVKETSKVSDLEKVTQELTTRENNLKVLHKELNKMLGGREGFDAKARLNAINESITRINNINQDILNQDYQYLDNIDDIDNVPSMIDEQNYLIDRLNSELNELGNEYEQIDNTVKAIMEQGGRDLQSLKQKHDELIAKQQEQLSTITTYPSLIDLDVNLINSSTQSVKSKLQDILSRLPDNSSGYILRSHVVEAKQNKESVSKQISVLDNQINQLEHRKYHLTTTDKTQCPNCNHVFVPGAGDETLDTIESKLKDVNAFKEDLVLQLNKIDNYLIEVNDYISIYNELQTLMGLYDVLSPLWNHLKQFKLSEYPPAKLQREFNVFEQELYTLHQARLLDKDIQVIQDALRRLNEETDANAKYNRKSLDELSVKIENKTKQLNESQARRKYLLSVLDFNKNVQRLNQSLVDEIFLLDEHKRKFEQDAWDNFLESYLNDINTELGRINIKLSDLKVTEELIKDLQKRRDEAHELKQVYSVLVDEMSPTTGLIAEHSLKFITQFTDQMNAIINSIWTYDMQILPLAISEDLTYKFPVYMSESGTETPDINKASTAQRNVIDFAFKILLMTYLGLDDYPLYLDELTPSLDEAHRINIIDYVKEFVEAKRCSQMFMISHHIGSHNGFSGGEYMVISDTNLLNRPDIYNTNVTFKFES